MNWNDLKVFLAVADTGTLAGAAKQLRQNHSTVFRRLNQLEADLGVRLFDRGPTGYVPTPAGERMVELAREADGAVQRIALELAGRDIQPAGKVRITTAANIARTILPPAIKFLRRQHPQISLEISVGDSDYDLNRREADIALRATTRPPEHLIGRKVMDLCWWVCRAGTERSPPPRSIEALKGKPFIGADAALMRLAAFQWLETQCGADIVVRANDLSTMAAYIAAGIGYGLLPSDQPEKGLTRVLRLPDLKGQLWILTHPDLRKVQRIQVVWDALVQATAGA